MHPPTRRTGQRPFQSYDALRAHFCPLLASARDRCRLVTCLARAMPGSWIIAEASVQHTTTPGSGRTELVGYLLAVLILVVGGTFVLGPILNWVSGPVIVVVCVWLTTSLSGRRGRAK